MTIAGVKAGLWLLNQSDRSDERFQWVWAAGAAFWQESERFKWDFEAFSGIDPIETALQDQFGDGKRHSFLSVKTEVAFHLFDSMEAFAGATYFLHDQLVPYFRTWSLITGMTWLFTTELSVAVNFEGIMTNSRLESADYNYDESRALFEVAYKL